ncbi:MAG: MFS transporter [Acidobacteria bacterium]|nr:MFS transporter [Acidobacteriota bacterium]
MSGNQKKQAWFALWVLFGINLMNFFDRQIPAAVTEPIRMEWGLSDTDIGLLATAFTLIYAAAGVPLGRLADRGERTKVLAYGVTIWSVLTAASGLAWNYSSLFAARLGVGIGEASCSPASNSLIGDLFPAHQRARAISVFMLGLPIGIFLSNLISGNLAQAFNWRVPFFVACVPGLLLAVMVLRVREPLRGAAEAYQMKLPEREGSPYWRVLSIPTMWWIILSGALHNFNAYAVNAFMPAFLGRYHGLDLKDANTITAFVLGAVGVVGLLAGGLAADWISKKRNNGRLLLSAASLAVSTPCVYLALGQPKGAMVPFVVLMGIGWMLIYVYYVTVYAAVQDVVEPGLRGTAMALYFFAMYVLGGSFGTMILGKLSDYYASRAMTEAGATVLEPAFRAAGLHSAFYVVPVVSLLLTFVLLAAARTVSADMEKLQSWMRESAAKQTG